MKKIRKTKIICTLGPSTESDQVIRDLMLAGMDVARFNFSHGDHEEQGGRLERIKRVREELKLPVATLLDTKGPEIRLGNFKNGKEELKVGQTFTLTVRDVEGTKDIVSISYKDLIKDVSVGSLILIDDGLIGMEVTALTDTDIICMVKNSGKVSNHKGVNVPGVELTMPYISEKDYNDIVFAIEQGYDYIAASFVRSAEDVLEIRKIFDEMQAGYNIKIISKIENRQGVNNIDEIIRVSDGIMVARGDMGVEIPLEEVPAIQKKIIKKVYKAGKQVITATQMLDSMMKNPRPTRAEATDVANAIYDGTSAIMLSGETAAGLYPVESVKTMVKIALHTEADINYSERFHKHSEHSCYDVTDAISHATCMTAIDLKASAIITVTKSGSTARMVSKFRPYCPIVACCTTEETRRQLNLSWGVTPIRIDEKEDTHDLFDAAMAAAEDAGLVQKGEVVILTAGVPLGVSGTTNLMKVQVVGDVLISAKGVTKKVARGSVCVCNDIADLEKKFKNGDIIVASETNNEMLQYIKNASALVVERDGLSSHAAVVGLSLEIPVILGAKHATQILKSGSVITVDGERGIVLGN
ncbi:pyruvate kinase [Anaerosacchariphilus polymeriproducens]|uniref:Pyruvate kinase n=1 Tax=Anaerosacchariphilus polymeriproducens TaxID=1812858 RepID=A0A371ARJ5_9FIRM|nr:pyruvate kinase [Anaerosacchariphilus polymeriproducens]RDU22164.1 pyruvate kinase [Anaerosacchariphilus polymeriproducens]